MPWREGDLPVLSDIDFRADGSMVIAVRNLALDAALAALPPRLGDLLPALPEANTLRVVLTPERFNDALTGADEALTGGLAVLPGLDLVGAVGQAETVGASAATAAWLAGATGERMRLEGLAPATSEDSAPVVPELG